MKRRVVITGLGLVTPVGNGVESSWDALLAGTSGASPITQFDATEDYGTRFACEVIPAQLSRGSKPVLFNPAELKVFGLP